MYHAIPILVLNDDRNNTKDSREFGYIHKASQIEGVVNLRSLSP